MRGAENKVNFKRLSQIQILPEAHWNFTSGQDIIKVTVAMICKECVFDFPPIREGTKRTQAHTKPSFKRLFTNNEMHFLCLTQKEST